VDSGSSVIPLGIRSEAAFKICSLGYISDDKGDRLDMSGFGDVVQKAIYLGLGIASYAGEKAGETFSELKVQAQKLADEMVARGEMSAEEAQRFVNEAVSRAQAQQVVEAESNSPKEPRRIEILSDEDVVKGEQSDVEALRQQLADLQNELHNLKQD